jgi:hypothetical protein
LSNINVAAVQQQQMVCRANIDSSCGWPMLVDMTSREEEDNSNPADFSYFAKKIYSEN